MAAPTLQRCGEVAAETVCLLSGGDDDPMDDADWDCDDDGIGDDGHGRECDARARNEERQRYFLTHGSSSAAARSKLQCNDQLRVASLHAHESLDFFIYIFLPLSPF